MKKFAVLALAALLVVAFTVPASALENIFGGYWRTRMFIKKNFDGDGHDTKDIRRLIQEQDSIIPQRSTTN